MQFPSSLAAPRLFLELGFGRTCLCLLVNFKSFKSLFGGAHSDLQPQGNKFSLNCPHRHGKALLYELLNSTSHARMHCPTEYLLVLAAAVILVGLS